MNRKSIFAGFIVFILTVSIGSSFADSYEHDPRLNSRAMEDIVVNPDAVYGFSPDPDGTLAPYAKYDWTIKENVEEYRNARIEYLAANKQMYELLYEMVAEGKTSEEIARAISAKRNELRIASYDGDPDGLATLKERNLLKYGHEDGPTADELFEQYGSWDIVTEKAFSHNPGMDACVGIYDDYYSYYIKFGYIENEENAPASREYAIAAFVEATGVEGDAAAPEFKDSDKISTWFEESISKAIGAGLIKGYEDNTLRPEQTIKRVEAMVLLSRFLSELDEVQEAIEFEDIPKWAKADIDRLSKAGLIKGYGEEVLGANDDLTVAQVKILVKRLTDDLKRGQ